MKPLKLIIIGLCLATSIFAQETNIKECKALAELKLDKGFTEEIKFIDHAKDKFPLMLRILTDMHWMNCNETYENFCKDINTYSSSPAYTNLINIAHEDEKLYKIFVYSNRALNCDDKQSLNELKKIYKEEKK